jgi:hypothetical protein
VSEYHVFPSKSVPGEWYAEPTVERGIEPCGALFYGPESKQRAEEYAAWKNERRLQSPRGGPHKPINQVDSRSQDAI